MWPESFSTSSGPRGHVEHLVHPGEGGRFGERVQARASGSAVVGAERLVDDRAVVGLAHDQAVGLASLDRDLLLAHLEPPPLAFEDVLLALDPLDEEVLDVGHHVGDRPGDVVVLAHVDPRHPRQRGAADETAARGAARSRTRCPACSGQVRVTGDQRRAGHRAGAGDGPVVGAAGLRGEAERRGGRRRSARRSRPRRRSRFPG